MFRIKNSDLLFYIIVAIGIIMVYSGLQMVSLSQPSTKQINAALSSSSIAPTITQINPGNQSLLTTGFNIMDIGFAVVFADVVWYEFYFHKKILNNSFKHKK